jgi:hypothetical protein
MRSMVEGRARSALLQNQRNYAVEIVPNVRGHEAQRLYASGGKDLVAPLIARRIVPHIMACAVNLDRQRRGVAVEIERIGLAGMLASEFESARASPQHCPQPALGRRHSATELPRPPDRRHKNPLHHPPGGPPPRQKPGRKWNVHTFPPPDFRGRGTGEAGGGEFFPPRLYTTPNASIASATFLNPAMLAPFT